MTDSDAGRRIYLDNAATSFPKPAAVYTALDNYNRQMGAPAGRGSYSEAIAVTGLVHRCRKQIAELLGAERPERILFTFNGTDSLNLALHGLLRQGDHVVTSVLEHNSVIRPLRALQERLGIELSVVGVGQDGRVSPDEIRRALRPQTRLIALTHASNVTGVIQPVESIAHIAREAGVFTVIDAAQTAGHLPIDLKKLPCDVLACSGHKGLLGPLGTGVLYLRPGLEEHVRSFRQGGTGTVSEDERQPNSLPDKYESGNHNAPGIIGLQAAIEWLEEQTVTKIADQTQKLTRQLTEGLARIGGVRLFSPTDETPRTSVVSFTLEHHDPEVLGAILDNSFGIQTRPGLHCAPGIHRALGTLPHGGTLRFSIGPFNTSDDIEATIAAVKKVAQSAL